MAEIIAGFHSGHDCSFGILKDGRPVVHAELERYIRLKEPIDDSLKFLFEKYDESSEIKHFTTGIDTWEGGPQSRYPDTWQRTLNLCEKNNGNLHIFGHHQSHAANAFFSSNFDEALIITIDGGGQEIDESGAIVNANFTVWSGIDNKINKIAVLSEDGVNRSTNIGGFWSQCTERIFRLSAGYPYGHQAGTIMAMAALGEHNDFYEHFYDHLSNFHMSDDFNYGKYKNLENSELYSVARALQSATETRLKDLIGFFLEKTKSKKLCLSGGVSLNCVMVGKIHDWFEDLEGVYVDPIPYDAGLALGSARYLWHHVLDNPRIKWEDNSSPYLGFKYDEKLTLDTLENFQDKVDYKRVDDEDVVDLLIEKNVISIFGGGSESGRRALGNRSIIADPRHADMKTIVNERVKHRQWYRPFAPSILREHVSEWFVRDISSPYMSFAIPFKEEKVDLVPAVVHLDNTARLQTVTKKDNSWYHSFISKFFDKTGVPIILNTSFNDREPIVEFPEHAVKCFLKTQIDYLYFYDYGILVSKRQQ